MYESYFGLTERPFSIAPDPHYLYMSSRHKEAMAHLSYGLLQGGCFIVLTGEVGTGKTTLCRNLLRELPENVDVALILNANINETELLETVCDELKIAYDEGESQKKRLDRINHYLLEAFSDNRHTVLIIDEAQLLSRDVLEQIRLLTNLETTKSKLLQIILIGQPELNEVLSRNDLRQLAQRVTARYHLGALQSNEIEEYVNRRLSVAGCKQPLFSRQALSKLHSLTDGIPRKINVLADHALLSAYSKTQPVVDAGTVKKASGDVFISSSQTNASRFAGGQMKWWCLAFALLLLNGAAWWYFSTPKQTPSTVVASTPSSEAPSLATTASPSENTASVLPENVEPDTSTTLVSQTPQAGKDTPSGNALIDDALAVSNDNLAPGSVVISEQPLTAEPLIEAPNVGEAIDSPFTTAVLNSQTRVNEDTEFGRILAASADLTVRINAFRRLSTEWETLLPNQLLKPICQELLATGLRCLAVSNWPQLVNFNRPAIIVLAHEGQLHRVIVQSLDGSTNNAMATVLVGDTQHRVRVSELRDRWTNDGVLFWRPTAGVGFYKLNDRDPQILTLRLHLNRALAKAGMPLLANIDSTVFDADMSQKVFALQSRFNVISDSIIGHETHLLMNELVTPEATPLLMQRHL